MAGLGSVASTSTVTLTNGTAKTLTIRGTVIGLDFKIVSTTCSSVVRAGQSCYYVVGFQPQSTGTKNEVLRVTDSATNSPQKVQLRGTSERN